LLKRYGLPVLKAQRVVNDINTRFQEIYDHGETAFRTPREMLEAVDLDGLVDQSGYDYFDANNIGSRFVREYVNGATRTFYGQDAAMNAVACLTSLAGLGTVGSIYTPLAGLGTVGSIYTLEASNVELCQALLSDAGAEVKTETPVQQIRTSRSGDPITVRTPEGRDSFDVVCLATPLPLADISFEGADLTPTVRSHEFVELSVVFVEGQPDPTYFGVDDPQSVPGLVVTEATKETEFIHLLTREEAMAADRSLYKLTSRGRISDSLLESMFECVEDVTEITWKAFPRLEPTSTFSPFKFAPGLYYVNAMESIVSTMETEVIGSRNVANLISADISE